MTEPTGSEPAAPEPAAPGPVAPGPVAGEPIAPGQEGSGAEGSTQEGSGPEGSGPEGSGQEGSGPEGSERDGTGEVVPQTEPEPHRADMDAATPDASSDAELSDEASSHEIDAARAESVADDPEAANGQVAAALGELDDAADWPPADQVAAFTAAHETLQATLARIDDH